MQAKRALGNDIMDPYIVAEVSGCETVRTAAKEDDQKPHFNERFVFTISAEDMATGEVVLRLMDKDSHTTDDEMASVSFKFPAPSIQMCERLELVPSKTGFMGASVMEEKEGKPPVLDVNCMLIAVSDLLAAPVLLKKMDAELAAQRTNSAADAEIQAAMREQIDAMAVDDVADEEAKAEMEAQLAALTAEIEAARVEDEAAAAERDAAEAAAAEALAAKAAELEAMEVALEEEDADDAAKDSKIATLKQVLGDTRAQLKTVSDDLAAAKVGCFLLALLCIALKRTCRRLTLLAQKNLPRPTPHRRHLLQ